MLEAPDQSEEPILADVGGCARAPAPPRGPRHLATLRVTPRARRPHSATCLRAPAARGPSALRLVAPPHVPLRPQSSSRVCAALMPSQVLASVEDMEILDTYCTSCRKGAPRATAAVPDACSHRARGRTTTSGTAAAGDTLPLEPLRTDASAPRPRSAHDAACIGAVTCIGAAPALRAGPQLRVREPERRGEAVLVQGADDGGLQRLADVRCLRTTRARRVPWFPQHPQSGGVLGTHAGAGRCSANAIALAVLADCDGSPAELAAKVEGTETEPTIALCGIFTLRISAAVKSKKVEIAGETTEVMGWQFEVIKATRTSGIPETASLGWECPQARNASGAMQPAWTNDIQQAMGESLMVRGNPVNSARTAEPKLRSDASQTLRAHRRTQSNIKLRSKPAHGKASAQYVGS